MLFGFKKWLLPILPFLVLIGCGTTENYQQSFPQEALLGDNSNTSKSGNFFSMIAFDLVGGMFSTSSQVIEKSIITGGELSPLSSSKTHTAAIDSETQDLAIDTSFSFQGSGGYGKLVLTASGSGTKTFQTSTSTTPKKYQFNPLTLRFLFFNYTYYHDCMGEIRLNGEISCKVSGSYNFYQKTFSGKAICQNGFQEDQSTLLYSTDESNYEVALNSILEINGNPFSYSSYYYSGRITIDGVLHDIDDLMDSDQTCSEPL